MYCCGPWHGEITMISLVAMGIEIVDRVEKRLGGSVNRTQQEEVVRVAVLFTVTGYLMSRFGEHIRDLVAYD